MADLNPWLGYAENLESLKHISPTKGAVRFDSSFPIPTVNCNHHQRFESSILLLTTKILIHQCITLKPQNLDPSFDMKSFSLKLGFPARSRETSPTSLKAEAAIRVEDLESRLFEKPAGTPRSFWSRLFSCCILRPDKEPLAPLTSNNRWAEYANGHDSDINPYRSYIVPAVRVSTLNDGIRSSATTDDDGKLAAHDSISSTQSACLLTAGETNFATAKENGNIATHKSLATAAKSANPFGMSTISKTGDGSAPQHIIAPPTNGHSPTSSNDFRSRVRPSLDIDGPAALVNSVSYAPKPSIEHSLRSARRALPTSTRPSIDVDSLAALAASNGHAFKPSTEHSLRSARPALPASIRLSRSVPDHEADHPFRELREDWARY